MYQLTCPECSHSVRGPFVRIGAVVDCPSCRHRYRIAAAHVKRQVQWAIAATPEANELSVMGTDAKAEHAAQQVVGLSGLSEMMRQEANGRDKAPSRKPDPPAPAVESPAIPTELLVSDPEKRREVSVVAARIKRKKRKKQMRVTLAMVGVTVIFAVLVVVNYARWQKQPSSGYMTHVGDDAGQARLSQARSPWPGLERLQQWRRLRYEPWQSMNQSFTPPTGTQRDYMDILREGALQPGQHVMSARVRAWRDRVLMHGRWQVSLVDRNGTEVARTYVPIISLVPGQAQAVDFVVPVPLRDRDDLFVRFGSITEAVTEPTAYYLYRMQHEVRRENDLTMLRFAVYNTENVAMQKKILLINGLDVNQRPVARWMAEWSGLHETDMWRESWVALYVPSQLGVVDWSVEAIGFDQPVRMPAISMESGDAGPNLPAVFFNLDSQGRPVSGSTSRP